MGAPHDPGPEDHPLTLIGLIYQHDFVCFISSLLCAPCQTLLASQEGHWGKSVPTFPTYFDMSQTESYVVLALKHLKINDTHCNQKLVKFEAN